MRILSLVVGCWMLVATCFAQETPVIRPTPLAENVTIHIHGSVAEDCTVDFQLSGVGPMFACNLADPSTHFQGTLSTTGDDKLTLEYSMGVSIPVKGEGNTMQYREFAVQGRVMVAFGEEIKITTIHGKDLIIAVTKYAKSKKQGNDRDFVTNSIGALLTLTNFGGASQPQAFYRFDITP